MNEFLQPADRRRTWVIAAFVVVVTLVIVAVGTVLIRTGGDSDGESPPAQSTGSPAPSASITSTSPEASSTDGDLLRLVPGRRRVSGVAVGYPHSVAGAVSAAVEIWSQVGSTLDPDRA